MSDISCLFGACVAPDMPGQTTMNLLGSMIISIFDPDTECEGPFIDYYLDFLAGGSG